MNSLRKSLIFDARGSQDAKDARGKGGPRWGDAAGRPHTGAGPEL